jgi:hypothetical protein
MSIDSFHLSQIYSTTLELEYEKGGIIILKNHDVISKMRQTERKNK